MRMTVPRKTRGLAEAVSALGIEDQVDAEQGHAQKAADDGAEETVSAVEPGVVHIGTHVEDGTDAGKGGIAVQKIVDESAERQRGQS